MLVIQAGAGVALDVGEAARLERVIGEGEGRALRVNVHVLDDAEMSRLHAEHFGDPTTTDVITFDLAGDGPGGDCAEDVDGELLVNWQMAQREARERGHDPASELLFYVAHGLLHLLGYDDHTPAARDSMLTLQAAYLARIGRGLGS